MIRVKCPKCEKRLTVDDSRAGGVGACPACGQKFRIPGTKAQPAKKPQPAQAKEAAPKGRPGPPKAAEGKPAKQPPARPKEEWETNDSSPYVVEKVVESEVPKELRQSMHGSEDADEDMEYEDFGLDREYVARKKARKRKERAGQFVAGLSYLTAIRLFLGLIWAALLVLGFFFPELTLLGTLVASAVMLAGFVWMLVIAFQDDGVVQGLLCLFVPFYSLYYLVTHWDREKNPFYVWLIGLFISVTVTAVSIYHAQKPAKTSSAALFKELGLSPADRPYQTPL